MPPKKKGPETTGFPVPKSPVPDAAKVAAAATQAVRPRQSLNELEEALRRHYGLVGEIRATLDPILTPVIIAGDIREPGHAVNRGRSFSWALGPALGAAAGVNVLSVRIDADAIILGVWAAIPTFNQGLSLYVTVPGETIPIAVTGACGSWTDRKTAAGDTPPLMQTAAFNAVTGTAMSNTNRVASWGQVGHVYMPIQMMVTAGSALTFRSENTQTMITAGFHGRIFP